MPFSSRAEKGLSSTALVFVAGILLTGCSSIPAPEKSTSEDVSDTSVHLNSNPAAEAASPRLKHIRYDRYTVISTFPKPDQTDLLAQIIDIRIPDALTPSVQDAMTYVLRRSGYQLCPTNSDLQLLYSHALPASHYQLGPITLRDALQVLAGPAWELEVDDLARSICFAIRPSFHRPTTALISTPTSPVTDVMAQPGGE